MELKDYKDWLSTFVDIADIFNYKLLQTFRINTLKIPIETFEEISNLKYRKIPWIKEGRIYEDEYMIGRTFEYFLGYLHPQSLSSMVPPLALGVKKREKVLDLTAAPGSKTTQMASIMENTGVIVANDRRERETALISNIIRLGVLNTVISFKDAKRFPVKNEFDKVLLDAPCTALGSSPRAYEHFTPESSDRLSSAQRRMILSAFDSLKEGGELIYSTCTYSPYENEGVVDYLLEKRKGAKLENINLEIPHESGLSEYLCSKKVWRIYPKHFHSEGFFLAKIKKVVE